MSALLQMICFNSMGYVVQSSQISLPDAYDWKAIEEKELFVRFMGGLPAGTAHILITSQGQQRLVSDLSDSIGPPDHQEYRRKLQNVESYVDRRCEELGIDRTRKPRNQ